MDAPTPNKALDEGEVPSLPPSLTETASYHRKACKNSSAAHHQASAQQSFTGPVLPKLMASPTEMGLEKRIPGGGSLKSCVGQGEEKKHGGGGVLAQA